MAQRNVIQTNSEDNVIAFVSLFISLFVCVGKLKKIVNELGWNFQC